MEAVARFPFRSTASKATVKERVRRTAGAVNVVRYVDVPLTRTAIWVAPAKLTLTSAMPAASVTLALAWKVFPLTKTAPAVGASGATAGGTASATTGIVATVSLVRPKRSRARTVAVTKFAARRERHGVGFVVRGARDAPLDDPGRVHHGAGDDIRGIQEATVVGQLDVQRKCLSSRHLVGRAPGHHDRGRLKIADEQLGTGLDGWCDGGRDRIGREQPSLAAKGQLVQPNFAAVRLPRDDVERPRRNVELERVAVVVIPNDAPGTRRISADDQPEPAEAVTEVGFDVDDRVRADRFDRARAEAQELRPGLARIAGPAATFVVDYELAIDIAWSRTNSVPAPATSQLVPAGPPAACVREMRPASTSP